MSGGFSDLVKIYIENLNLSADKKKKLLASCPKTLTDVSLWLENNKEVKRETKTTFDPFSKDTKSNLLKEIKLFSDCSAPVSGFSGAMFNDNALVSTDDASWGLGIDKIGKPVEVTNASYKTQPNNAEKNSSQYTQSTSKDRAVKNAQDNAIASIRENVNSSIEIVMKQMEEQGIISSAYNSLKEYFDSQLALSSVCRVMFCEKTGADLLQKAQDGNLTREEYWKTKIASAIDMLTAGRELSDEERTCLEERFAQFTPDELNALIDKIKYANNDDYAKVTSKVDKLIEEGRNLLQSRRSDSSSVSLNDKPNSVGALMKSGAGSEIMTFDEVYKLERGVEFNPQAIQEYEEAAAKYALAAMVTNKAEKIHNMLKDAMTLVDGNNKYCVDGKGKDTKTLEISLISALKELYGDDEAKINEELQEFSDGSITYKNGRIEYNQFSQNNKGMFLINVSKKLLEKIDSNAEKIKGPYSLGYYQDKMASAYEQAYGRKNASQLAQAFENDQNSIVGKVRSGVEYAGMGVMVAGMFICPPMAFAGAMTASFGGIGVEALNESTKKEGMSEEAKKKITQEVVTNAALFAVGGAAGKMGSAAKAALIAQKCPTLMACIADIGIDSTISLIGDLALTGQIDIEGEGLSQLMSVLAGHFRAAKFGKNKISSQDMAPGKNPVGNHALEELKRTDRKLYEDYQLLRNKNLLPENFGNAIINARDSKLSSNIKKDIALLADCVRKGIDPKDAFIPKMKSLQEAAKEKKQGEVFSLEGTNDVYIMDESGPVKLDMDRDMYYSLFPPVKSYCTTQGLMGDCYFVSGVLDGAMNNPKAKVEMMKMIHQKGDDIIIEMKEYSDIDRGTLPSSTYDNCPRNIVFKNAKKRLSYSANAGINGADGLKLIEEAYGYKLAATEIANCMKDLNIPQDKQKRIFEELQKVFEDDSYKPTKEFEEIMKKAFNSKRNYLGEKTYKEEPNMVQSTKARILISLNGIESLRQKAMGNGGVIVKHLHNFFGLTKTASDKMSYPKSEEELARFLSQFRDNPDLIFTATSEESGSKLKDIAEQLAIEFGIGHKGANTIIGMHAYRIDSFDLQKRTISIVNPWDTSKVITMSFEKFLKYFVEVNITDVSKTNQKEIFKPLADKMSQLNNAVKSPNGRDYTNSELIDNYVKKLKEEKNLISPRHRSIDADDYINEDIYKNKAVTALYNKLADKHGDYYAKAVMKALSALGDIDEQQLESIAKKLDKLLNNPDIGFETAYKLATTVQDDYIFMIEQAPEIFAKLKEKGYSDEIIIQIIQNTGKENYQEMKKLWE